MPMRTEVKASVAKANAAKIRKVKDHAAKTRRVKDHAAKTRKAKASAVKANAVTAQRVNLRRSSILSRGLTMRTRSGVAPGYLLAA